MQIDAAAFVLDAIRWIAAGAVAIIAWLIRGIVVRVNRLEERMVPREEIQYAHQKLHEKMQSKVDKEYLKDYMERAEVLRSETRQMIQLLFDKIDTLKDLVVHLSQQVGGKDKA